METQFCFLNLESDTALADLNPHVEENLRALRGTVPKHKQFKILPGEALPAELSSEHFAVLAGSCTPERLREICVALVERKVWPLVMVDAFYNAGDLLAEFNKLESDLFQLARTPAVVGSIRSGRYHIYPYAKPDCTSTVCLLFDSGTQALVIERLHYPFAGREAFPGGFLRVMVESMEDAAYRELEEECSIRLHPGELVCIDVRSAPSRDPRAHIIDVGYALMVSDERKLEIMQQLKAGDDASKAHLKPVSELLQPDALAFDHRDLLLNVLKHFDLPV